MRRKAIVLTAAGVVAATAAALVIGCGAGYPLARYDMSAEAEALGPPSGFRTSPTARPSAGARHKAYGPSPGAGREAGRGARAISRPDGLFDELWVIQKPVAGPGRALDKDDPTQGELRAKLPRSGKEVPLPLKHTDVKARVSAFVATVDVTQQYHNPYDVKLEAVYVFPLPQNSAVTDFVMVIGDRRIRGVIRERAEARKIYEEAKRSGHRAALLTQERPNIFTQNVANIEPGKRIDIKISYFSPLKYSQGEYEFVFPMVVGPRFNPPGSRNGVGAVAHGRRGRSGQATEVQYMKPGTRSGHDISITVDVDACVPIEDVRCHSHVATVKRVSASKARIKLSSNDAIPNKDFVLRYRVAGKWLKTALLTHRGVKTNTFALVLQPPAELADVPRMPREMVFVLDCSGSMSGWPINKAKEAMRRCLKKLGPDDTFQIIRFSNRASQLGPRPVPATPGNIRKGLEYVRSLRGTGGTMMIEGIKTALDFPHDPRRFRVVSFMTDGYIGNETEIFREAKKRLGASRIFSFGVGSSVNRYLIEGLARMGRGAVAYVGPQEGADRAVDLFYERCSRPALTDIKINWGGMKVSDVYPRRTPDLFVGRPVLLVGRFKGTGPTEVTVSGRCGRKRKSFTVKVDPGSEANRHAGIGKVWARWKLAHLGDLEARRASKELKDEITAVSLEHRVICNYTAFLAVEAADRTAGDHGVAVVQPVPVPFGVRYDTTVTE